MHILMSETNRSLRGYANAEALLAQARNNAISHPATLIDRLRNILNNAGASEAEIAKAITEAESLLPSLWTTVVSQNTQRMRICATHKWQPNMATELLKIATEPTYGVDLAKAETSLDELTKFARLQNLYYAGKAYDSLTTGMAQVELALQNLERLFEHSGLTAAEVPEIDLTKLNAAKTFLKSLEASAETTP